MVSEVEDIKPDVEASIKAYPVTNYLGVSPVQVWLKDIASFQDAKMTRESEKWKLKFVNFFKKN